MQPNDTAFEQSASTEFVVLKKKLVIVSACVVVISWRFIFDDCCFGGHYTLSVEIGPRSLNLNEFMCMSFFFGVESNIEYLTWLIYSSFRKVIITSEMK